MSITTVDGRLAVRFIHQLQHPLAHVWSAITDPEQLSQWYPLRVSTMELHVGGAIVFEDEDGTVITGTVTDYVPSHVFAFDEHDIAGNKREFDDHVRLELELAGDGCQLTFTHILTDPSIADVTSKGWQACLAALVRQLDEPLDR